MRRRDLLLIGSALSLPACGLLSGPAPRPSIPPGPALPSDAPPLSFTPPGPDAVPKSFLPTPQWPKAAVHTRIAAIHRQHLCAAVLRDETHAYPVVVNVPGPTTHVILSLEDGTFTTRDVELDLLASHLDPTVEHPELGHPLCGGAAIMDDDHAYLIVGRPVTIGDPLVAVHLVKVNLADGTVTASAMLSEWFTASELNTMSLAFAPDHTSLLIAGENPKMRSAGFIGLRLSTADLSIQFDAHSIIPDKARVKAAGEALTSAITKGEQDLVLLADGRTLTGSYSGSPFVRGHWCYYAPTLAPAMLRDLTTGVETPLPGLSDVELLQLRPWFPRIWSASAHLMFEHRFGETEQFSVWLPGESAPMIQWQDNEHPVPREYSVHGDILFSGANDSLEMRSLGSGEILGSIPWRVSTREIAVSAWGVATNERFFPANEWF